MFAALAITALLQLQAPARTAADEERSAFAAQVASLRARWLLGLDAAGWDRDRGDARALADALTAEGAQLRAARPMGSAAEDRLALDALLGDMGGAALLDLVRERPVSNARWVAPILRRVAESSDVAAILESASLEREAVDAAALWAPARAVPLIRAALGSERAGPACHAALLLPEALRRPLDPALATALAPHPGRSPEPACFIAALGLRASRRVAARWFDALPAQLVGHRVSPVSPSASAPALLAIGLAGSPEGSAAQRYLDGLTGPGRTNPLDDVLIRNAVDAAAQYSPMLPSGPGAQRALRGLALAADGGGWSASLARMRWRDASALDDALAVLASPGTRDHLALAAVRVVGITTPDEPDAVRRVARLLTTLGATVAAMEHPTLDAPSLARWIDALGAPACADASCLAAVFAGASDERAAREVWRLGARRLASLPPPVAQELVARVVRRGRTETEPGHAPPGLLWTATSWAVFATVEGCPRALRGLREAGSGEEQDVVVAPWRDAFVRACRDADLGAAR